MSGAGQRKVTLHLIRAAISPSVAVAQLEVLRRAVTLSNVCSAGWRVCSRLRRAAVCYTWRVLKTAHSPPPPILPPIPPQPRTRHTAAGTV